MRLRFSDAEWDVIERCHLLPTVKSSPARGTAVKELRTSLDLTDAEVDALREACLEQQAVSGFDEDYQLNALGRVLQDLIDKLYC